MIERRTPAVAIGDLVEDEALSRREADVQLPVLPPHHPAVDLEARALGLGDLERLDVVAQAPASAIAASTSKLPDSAGIGTTPWSSIRSTSRRSGRPARSGRRPGAPTRCLRGRGWMKATHRASRPSCSLGSPKLPGWPGVDLDRVEVGHTALGQRRLERGIPLDELLGLGELLDHRERLEALEPPPLERRGPSRAIVISCVLASARSSSTTSASRGSSGGRSPRSSRSIRSMQRSLRRAAQLDRDEPPAALELVVLRRRDDEAPDRRDLLGGQRVERVGRRHRGRGLNARL